MADQVCFTVNQVKLLRLLMGSMIGLSVLQTVISRGLIKDLQRVKRRYNNLHDASMYLFEIIEKNGVELTEFDEIAIHALVTEVRDATS